ncbi:MAG TPA: valine--tRNA ligase [Desulfotomaculum sp.]|nr:valine--tRNA ligase [Desulfotomaculum sp.]
MDKRYQPEKVEEKIYQFWEKGGYFTPKIEKGKKPFVITLPPPNVTGSLHAGHAMYVVEDIMARYQRVKGEPTLWLPGFDHAAIAVEYLVNQELKKEGKTKEEIGREEFLRRAHQFANRSRDYIRQQLKRLGFSLDWSREAYTMDEKRSLAVKTAFKKLYQKGLIYKGDYLVNWCPGCQTVISDLENIYEEEEGVLYYLSYGPITIATTRPETIFADVAVAVHPQDRRYQKLVGQKVPLPLTDRLIPVIADEAVDPKFGSGALKITPAHDQTDFEIGQRHHLPALKVVDEKGRLTNQAGSFAGLKVDEGRQKVVEALRQKGFLKKEEPLVHQVGHCERCGTTTETTISKQWFLKTKPLAQKAINAVKSGRVKIIPQHFEKNYFHWLENIHDRGISRQLWWGHRIPVWYCRDCAEIIVSRQAPRECSRCAGTNLDQDPDVLDTWFSSALWPFATLGWPHKTVDLAYYYPTSVLVTGRDIIFFWVARMIFSGLAFMGEVPFQKVFIHGLVLDAQGRKMSKSLGNGVDPIEVIESHGADSLRFMLVTGNTPGNDLRFYFERLEGARNFANKIWNASRFVIMNLKGYQPGKGPNPDHFTLADWWILSRYHTVIKEVTGNLAAYELGEAARVLYEFIWNELCDWYIELAKPRLYGNGLNVERENPTKDTTDRQTAQYVLVEVLRGTLEMFHPFMPFITEEIWQRLPHQGNTIMQAKWPVENKEWIRPLAQAQMEVIMNVVKAIRHIRSEMHIPPGKKAEAIIIALSGEVAALLGRWSFYIENLAQCQVEIFPEPAEKITQAAHAVTREAEIFIPLKGLIDLEKETVRLRKELTVLEKELAAVQDKLKKDSFLTKAPVEIIAKERTKETEFLTKLAAVKERLIILEGED